MKAQGTRAAILGAAVDLGSLRGLEELSMGGLASTVEMSKSGLFAHFGSKEELQLATVARAWEIFASDVLPGPRSQIVGGLDGLLDRWLSFYERRVFPGGCFFVASAVEFAGLGGPVRDALAETIDRQIEALELAVREARDVGELPGASDVSEVAFTLHSILSNAGSLFVVYDDPGVLRRARATIGALLQDWRPPALAHSA